MQKAILLLEDGTYFEGLACGKIGTTTGELCFTTTMTGYQEIFTDPSYNGQLLILTNVHLGNYGIKDGETETESDKIQINGIICREFTNNYSRDQATSNIQNYFEANNLVGITNVDTRAIVNYIRKKGTMNAILSSETEDIEALKAKLQNVPSMEGLELASTVSTKNSYTVGDEQTAKYRIAALDFGIKRNILKNFVDRNAFVKVFPANTTYAEMMSFKPDGFFISNGPGDPAVMDYAVKTVQEILEHNHPVFGICLGNQILARAIGVPTYKLHHGHRGGNHPVKNLVTGKCETTTQNHGFAVDADILKSSPLAELTHINLNDNTVEGFKIKDKNAFAVQYHPESSPGPHDSRYLFDEFFAMIDKA